MSSIPYTFNNKDYIPWNLVHLGKEAIAHRIEDIPYNTKYLILNERDKKNHYILIKDTLLPQGFSSRDECKKYPHTREIQPLDLGLIPYYQYYLKDFTILSEAERMKPIELEKHLIQKLVQNCQFNRDIPINKNNFSAANLIAKASASSFAAAASDDFFNSAAFSAASYFSKSIPFVKYKDSKTSSIDCLSAPFMFLAYCNKDIAIALPEAPYLDVVTLAAKLIPIDAIIFHILSGLVNISKVS